MGGNLRNFYISSDYNVKDASLDLSYKIGWYNVIQSLPIIEHCTKKAIDTVNDCTTGHNAGAGTVTVETALGGQNGCYKILTGANAGDDEFYYPAWTISHAEYNCMFFQLATTTLPSADNKYFFGFGNDTNDWGAGHPDGVYFYWNAGTLYACVGKGTSSTVTSTTVTPGTSIKEYAIRYDGTSFYFYCEQTLVATVDDANIPSGTDTFKVYAKAVNAGANTLKLNYYGSVILR
jgi:hypothetical protein